MLKIALLATLLVATAAGAQQLVVPSQPPTPSATEHHQAPIPNATENNQSSYSDQRGTERTPFVIKVLPSDSTKITTAADSQEHDGKASEDWWMIVPTCLLAVFTFGLFVYTARLWGATGNLVREAKETAQRQLRAYVYFDGPATRDWPPENSDRLSVILDVINGGSTWARNATYEKAIVKNPKGDPFDDVEWGGPTPNPISLGPNQRITLQFGDIPYVEIPLVQNKTLKIFLVARTYYEDVVSVPSVIHQTQFSREFIADSESNISFRHCATHNCVDEDCPADKPPPIK